MNVLWGECSIFPGNSREGIESEDNHHRDEAVVRFYFHTKNRHSRSKRQGEDDDSRPPLYKLTPRLMTAYVYYILLFE